MDSRAAAAEAVSPATATSMRRHVERRKASRPDSDKRSCASWRARSARVSAARRCQGTTGWEKEQEVSCNDPRCGEESRTYAQRIRQQVETIPTSCRNPFRAARSRYTATWPREKGVSAALDHFDRVEPRGRSRGDDRRGQRHRHADRGGDENQGDGGTDAEVDGSERESPDQHVAEADAHGHAGDAEYQGLE